MRPSRMIAVKYVKYITKRIIAVEGMYSTISVEWAGDQFGLGLT